MLDLTTLEGIRELERLGSEGLLQRVVGLYLQDSAGQLRSLRDAIERRDAEQAQRIAHSLKSSSASVGALDLAEQMKHIEHTARTGVLDGLTNMLTEAESQYARVVPELRAICPEVSP